MTIFDVLSVETGMQSRDSLKCLIASKYFGSSCTVEETQSSRGPAPTLRIARDLCINDPIAICTRLSSSSSAPNPEVLQWLFLSTSELRPFTLKKSWSANEKAFLLAFLEGLNTFLAPKTFLVRESLSLADIFVFVELWPVFPNLIDGQKNLVNLQRWCQTIANDRVIKSLLAQTESKPPQKATSAVGPKALKSQKPRILCLHGYRQDASSFRTKLGAFRKMMKSKAEFEFMTAPLKVPSSEDQEESGQRGWWFSEAQSEGADRDWFSAHQVSQCSKGFESSLEAISAFIQSHGPFDGILGFSQGAAMLLLLSLMQARGKLDFSFKFAIFVAPFQSQSTHHQTWFQDAAQIAIPNLIVIGDNDQVIPRSMSEAILGHFEQPEVLRHEGGHFVPATSQQKKSYSDFLARVAQL